MKEVKAFVDMMEQRTFKQGFASEMLEAIKESKEFQALKSLANAPKVEVTDEKWKMPVPEQGEYDWSKLNHGLYKIYWKDGGCSLASVGSLHSGKRWFAPCNWTSKDHSIASSAWNKVKDVERVEVDFDRDDEPKSESEKELISDGWIEHRDNKLPTWLNSKDFVEVEKIRGDIDQGNAYCFNWTGSNGNYVIAYRIISEPEEKKGTPLTWTKPLTPQDFGAVGYGLTDPTVALNLYNKWKTEHPPFMPDIQYPEAASKEKTRTYKLKDMYLLWYINGEDINADGFISKPAALAYKERLESAFTEKTTMRFIAITRADATEFYEGEGLEK